MVISFGTSFSPGFRKARTFQDLVARVERYGPFAALQQPIDVFLAVLPPGGAQVALEGLVRSGTIRTVEAALRSPTLRSEARWLGGAAAERALLNALAAWLDDAVTAARPSGMQILVPSAPTPQSPNLRPSGLSKGMPAAAFRAWAEPRGVSAWLDLSDYTLSRLLPPETAPTIHGFHPGRRLVDILARSSSRNVRIEDALDEALLKLLEGAADMIARGRAEAAVPRVLPTEGPVGAFARWLVDLRAGVAPGSEPLPRDVRAGWELSVRDEPPGVSVTDPGMAICSLQTNVTATVSLHGVGSCACTCLRRASSCSRRLGLVDRLLDLVSEPEPSPLLHEVISVKAMPAWGRTLRRLDMALTAPPLTDKEGEPLQLGWRLRERHGTLGLDPVGCRGRKRASTFKLSRLNLSDVRILAEFEHPGDREAAQILLPVPLSRHQVGSMEAPPALLALSRLVGHPRVFLQDDTTPAVVRTAELALTWTLLPDGGIRMSPLLGEEPLSWDDLAPALEYHSEGDRFALIEDERVTVVSLNNNARAVIAELRARGVEFPREAVPELIRRIPTFTRMLRCNIDPALRGAQVEPDPRPWVVLEPAPGGQLNVDVRVRPLPLGPVLWPGEGVDEVTLPSASGTVWCRRHLGGEPAQVSAALATVPLPEDAQIRPWSWLLSDPATALAALEALQNLGDAAQIHWTGPPRRITSVGSRALTLKVSVKRDWLAISGQVDVGGATVPILNLLRALRAGGRYLPVDEHTWVRLSEPLVAALRPLAAAGQDAGASMEISRFLTPLLDDLAADGVAVSGPAAWRDWLARLDAANHLDAALPAGLQAELRDYQLQGYRWIQRLAAWSPGAILADDMGLGKTVMALAVLLDRGRRGPALVITPTSVSYNWVRESARFTPGLRFRLYRGAGRQAMLSDLRPGDVLVTSYDLAVRDEALLTPQTWSTLVLDEAQAIRNAATLRARAVCALQAEFRLALTGTPVENRTSELWSLFRAVVPGLFGSWELFRDRFGNPAERGTDPAARRALAQVIRPFVLRRHKREVARELPARTEVQVDVTLSPAERTIYEAVRQEALDQVSEGALPLEQRRVQILAALTRLRQAACHPQLVLPDSGAPSAKLEQLVEILTQLQSEGHKALVFSQFVRLLTLVRARLEREGLTLRYLDGSTPEAKRREEVDRFQAGDGDVFLISLKAGGVGLNLTAATYVIHLDPWWNPAVEDQATDRAHRIGQDQPVTVYRLVARQTLEEAILSLHADKRALASDVLEGTASGASLSAAELVALLSTGSVGEEGGEEGA